MKQPTANSQQPTANSQQPTLDLKEGYIFDFISNIPVRGNPEEIDAVQPYSQILVNDYKYEKNQIQTRPQHFVKKSPSDTNGSFPIDIAVFKTAQKKESELYIIVECKKAHEKDGVSQLKDYMTLSSAEFGVWYNGSDTPIYLQKIVSSNGIQFKQIPNIPKNGENVEDIGRYKRKDLIVPHNLKAVFNSLRNHLAGNAVGTTRDEELAKQLINIIFTKIYDEKFTAPNDIVNFRAGTNESEECVADRISKLFKAVKTKYKEVIDVTDDINLDSHSLYYVVGQLHNYSLIDAKRDAIADAFETFIGYTLKGPQGQFFTPRNVVKLMVNILNQNTDEKVIDPACGSGGFIVESLRHIWSILDKESQRLEWNQLALQEEKQKAAMSLIYGIEKDSLLAKVSKAYMAILGDGKGGIFCEDSLELPNNWNNKTQQSIRLNSFDCLLANPPFGKDIKIKGKEKLAQYKLAKKWKKEGNVFVETNKANTEMPPQILFIERCLELLTDGGRMGIIIPETYFHAPRAQYVMDFMAKHNIFCLLDLPHNTFRPHNNAKCIAIFLEKNRPQQKHILMCVAEEMGHDHQGKEIFRWDFDSNKSTNVLWDDIGTVNDEISQLKRKIAECKQVENQVENLGSWVSELTQECFNNQKYSFLVEADIVRKAKVFVPRYFWQEKTKELQSVASKADITLISVQNLITAKVLKHFDGHGSPESENKGKGDVPYIRVKDIVNWEIYKDPTSRIPYSTYQSIFSERKALLECDVLYVRRGSYRIGSVAMVSPLDKEVLLTREILVLRVLSDNEYGITPYYLLYLFSHWITQEQAKNKILIETTLPNIADRWKELLLPIHNDKQKIKEISDKIKAAMDNKWLAVSQIQEIAKELGNLTT